MLRSVCVCSTVLLEHTTIVPITDVYMGKFLNYGDVVLEMVRNGDFGHCCIVILGGEKV